MANKGGLNFPNLAMTGREASRECHASVTNSALAGSYGSFTNSACWFLCTLYTNSALAGSSGIFISPPLPACVTKSIQLSRLHKFTILFLYKALQSSLCLVLGFLLFWGFGYSTSLAPRRSSDSQQRHPASYRVPNAHRFGSLRLLACSLHSLLQLPAARFSVVIIARRFVYLFRVSSSSKHPDACYHMRHSTTSLSKLFNSS